MTLLLTRSRSSSRAIREQVGPGLPASFGSSFSAVVGMPMFGRSLLTRARIQVAERGPILSRKEVPDFIPQFPGDVPLGEFEGRTFSARELNNRYSDIGLHFDRDMGADAVQILVDRKRAENIRNSIIARSPQDIISLGGRFGAALIASAIDPLELASIFIPIVGPARMAGLIARHGRVIGRAAVGFREGLGGSLLIEPGFYLVSKQLQDDYTFTDALINVFTGAVLGGGIGAAIGGVSRVRARARERVKARVAEEFEVTRVLERQGILDDITLKKADVKRLKKESRARTKELDAIRKAGTGEEPKVVPVRKRLAAERTEIDARKAVVAKELRVLQKKLKGEFPDVEPVDPKVAMDGLRAAVAQVVQGKSVDVGAVVNPRWRVLTQSIKEKRVELNQLKKDSRVRTRELDEIRRKGIGEDVEVVPVRERLAIERTEIDARKAVVTKEIRDLQKQEAVLTVEEAGKVASQEASPSRSSMHDSDAEARITEGAKEKELDAEAIEKNNAELREIVEQMRTPDKLSPDDVVRALRENRVIDPEKGMLDTRGSGVFLHGSNAVITELSPFVFGGRNIFGSGLYTTDALDVAVGYTIKGVGTDPTVHIVTPKREVKIYDIEKPMTPEVRKAVAEKLDPAEPESDMLNESDNLREFFDTVRSEINEPADHIMEFILDPANDALAKLGFDGFTHTGGKIVKGTIPHKVTVFFHRGTLDAVGRKFEDVVDIEVLPLDVEALRGAPVRVIEKVEVDPMIEETLDQIKKIDEKVTAAERIVNNVSRCMRR